MTSKTTTASAITKTAKPNPRTNVPMVMLDTIRAERSTRFVKHIFFDFAVVVFRADR